MAKTKTSKTKPSKINAPRKPRAAVVRDSDLAALAAQFEVVAAKVEELMVGFEERLASVEMKLDALVHLSAPPEREEDARPNGVLRYRPRKSRINLFE